MYIPEIFKVFTEQYPAIADSFKNIGDLCSTAGSMDEKTRHLVQLGIAVGAESKGAVRSHARRALELGAKPEEILQAVLMSGTMIGFPGMIAAYGWVKDVLPPNG